MGRRVPRSACGLPAPLQNSFHSSSGAAAAFGNAGLDERRWGVPCASWRGMARAGARSAGATGRLSLAEAPGFAEPVALDAAALPVVAVVSEATADALTPP